VIRRSLFAISLALTLGQARSGHAQASGFLLGEPSAASLGCAGARLAASPEPAAVWHNPAALAFGTAPAAFSMTVTGLRGGSRFSPVDGQAVAESRPDAEIAPALFAHLRIDPRVVVGIGFHVPFGFATAWPEAWAGAEQALDTRLYAAAFTSVIALRLSERWALALGGSILRAQIGLRTALPPEAGGQAALSGAAWGYSAPPLPGLRALGAVAGQAALLFRLRPERLHLAAVYHARAELPVTGTANFSPQNLAFSDLFADQTVRAPITLPDIFSVGVMVTLGPGVALTADVAYVRWSTFERLRLDFERPGTPDVSIERGTRNPLGLRVGIEAWLPQLPVALRGGVAFDATATPAENLAPFAPDGDRLGVGMGAGIVHGHLGFDLGYLYRHFLPAQARSPQTGSAAPPRGRYRTGVHALAATLTVR
jgi:long-chain fatty acid transport protein